MDDIKYHIYYWARDSRQSEARVPEPQKINVMKVQLYTIGSD